MTVRRGSFEDIASLRRFVAGSRREEVENALDHYGHLGSPLVYWFGHLVHDGRIPSRSPGHRGRGDTD